MTEIPDYLATTLSALKTNLRGDVVNEERLDAILELPRQDVRNRLEDLVDIGVLQTKGYGYTMTDLGERVRRAAARRHSSAQVSASPSPTSQRGSDLPSVLRLPSVSASRPGEEPNTSVKSSEDSLNPQGKGEVPEVIQGTRVERPKRERSQSTPNYLPRNANELARYFEEQLTLHHSTRFFGRLGVTDRGALRGQMSRWVREGLEVNTIRAMIDRFMLHPKWVATEGAPSWKMFLAKRADLLALVEGEGHAVDEGSWVSSEGGDSLADWETEMKDYS